MFNETNVKSEMLRYNREYLCTDDPEYKKEILKINEGVSEEAKTLHQESIVIDTCSFYMDSYSWNLEASGVTAINLTIPDDRNFTPGHAVKRIADIDMAIRREPDKLKIVESVNDILECKSTGRVGLIIGAQNCEFFFHDALDAMVDFFARMGMRIAQIAYNHRSFAADGGMTGCDAGLTNDGKRLIKAMEKSGITVDLSHVGRQSCLDASKVCTKPLVYTHCSPYAMFKTQRGASDEQIQLCAETGGVIGLTAWPSVLWDGKTFPSMDRFIDSICYVVDMVGIEHVGIGLDTNAQAGAYDRQHARGLEAMITEPKGAFMTGYRMGLGRHCIHAKGLINLANWPAITDALLKRGFHRHEVKKILGENYMRVFSQTWRQHSNSSK